MLPPENKVIGKMAKLTQVNAKIGFPGNVMETRA